MFEFFSQKKLTEYSNHYIDWSRVGELFRSGSHRYSNRELVTRGGIIAVTAAFAYLGAHLNDQEETSCSDFKMAMGAGLLGFTISHGIVIAPLIKKRCQLSRECTKLVNDIEAYMEQSPAMDQATKALIHKRIQDIMTLSLSDDKHAKASQTWGKRKALLTCIRDRLYAGEPMEHSPVEMTDRVSQVDQDGTKHLVMSRL